MRHILGWRTATQIETERVKGSKEMKTWKTKCRAYELTKTRVKASHVQAETQTTTAEYVESSYTKITYK